MLNLNIGGWKRHPFWKEKRSQWKIVDIHKNSDYVVDLNSQKLPFSDNSVDAIYSSHTIEHLLPHMLPIIFFEMYRVLKPDSKIRIVVPDIDMGIKAYQEKNIKFFQNKDAPTKLSCLPDLLISYLNSWFITYRYENNIPNFELGGHLIGFNFELLQYYLKLGGFIDITTSEYESGSIEFRGLDNPRYSSYSIYVEASK